MALQNIFSLGICPAILVVEVCSVLFNLYRSHFLSYYNNDFFTAEVPTTLLSRQHFYRGFSQTLCKKHIQMFTQNKKKCKLVH